MMELKYKEFSGTWQEIWNQKGMVEGTKEDVLEYGGWNKTITPASEIASKIIALLNIKETDKILEVGCGAGGVSTVFIL